MAAGQWRRGTTPIDFLAWIGSRRLITRRASHELEIVARTQPPVQILVVLRRLGKARVVVSHEGREEGFAIRQSCRAGQPQLFDQPILQGPVRRLDPTLGRARIGANDVDVQRMQRPAKLGYAVTGEGAWMVDVGDDP
jgi:hypothetical protein